MRILGRMFRDIVLLKLYFLSRDTFANNFDKKYNNF